MANKEYFLPIHGQLTPVPREVYKAYYQLVNHEEYLERKDKKNGKVLFSDLDTGNMVGEAAIPDLSAVSIEDLAIANILRAKLKRCLALLAPEDRSLLEALFYEELSERKYAEALGISQSAVHKRKKSALRKLKNLFEQREVETSDEHDET